MRLPSIDVTTIVGIPVTTPARTLIDIAADAHADVLEEALDDALRRGLVKMARLRWRIAETAERGRPGIRALRNLVEARTTMSAPQSVLESKLVRLLRRSEVPAFKVQHHVRERGRLVAIVDIAFPAAKVAIEADGYRWHSSRLRWEHDLARRNALTALGWRVIHVTWRDVTDHSAKTVDAIAGALRRASAVR